MRLRITFSKTGPLRYTGHLDLHQVWERTIRRAGLPLMYTQGFHPGPKIQIAAALPLGFSGRAEVMDIWLESGDMGPRARALLQTAAPSGLDIISMELVDERVPALQTQVTAAEYEATLLKPVGEAALKQKVAALLAAQSLPRERRGRSYDLRPLVEELRLLPSPSRRGAGACTERSRSGEVCLFMRLCAREGATGRPEEVLDGLGIPPDTARIERTRLIFFSKSLE